MQDYLFKIIMLRVFLYFRNKEK